MGQEACKVVTVQTSLVLLNFGNSKQINWPGQYIPEFQAEISKRRSDTKSSLGLNILLEFWVTQSLKPSLYYVETLVQATPRCSFFHMDAHSNIELRLLLENLKIFHKVYAYRNLVSLAKKKAAEF